MLKIEIQPPNKIRRNPWGVGIFTCLLQGESFGLFKVKSLAAVPHLPKLPCSGKVSWIKVNGKLIAIDVWDYSPPMYTWMNDPAQPEIPELALIIKIQKSAIRIPPSLPHRKVPISAWSMFHTNQGEWLDKLNARREMVKGSTKRHLLGCTGRTWRNRTPWVKEIQRQPWIYSHFWPGRARTGTFDEYVALAATWSCCLGLQGKGDRYTSANNRRDAEMPSLGIPLVLSYAPHYFNDYLPGVHYHRVSEPKDLKKLPDILTWEYLEELAENSRSWWNDNCSPRGLCKSLLQVLEAHEII